MSDAIAQLVAFLKADRATILRDGHKEVFVARAPGRLDVMGGASEYAGGLACQMPLATATAVAVQRRDDRNLVLKTYNEDASRESVVSLSLDDFYGTASLLPHNTMQGLFAGGKHWAAYLAGAFPTLGKHKKLTRRAHGANIACFSSLPLGAGAASSAALECATLWAVTAAYHLILDPLEIALLAQKIENQLVGTRAGVVDPATSVLGRKDQLLLLQCQPHEVTGYVDVPGGYFFAGISCGAADAAAEARLRVGAFMAQKIVGKFFADTGVKKDPTRGYLVNVAPESLERYFRTVLPEAVSGEKFIAEFGAIGDRLTAVDAAATYQPRAAAEFHVGEHRRAQAFAAVLREMNRGGGDAKQLAGRALAVGKFMQESHAAARQVGLGNKVADHLVEMLMKLGPERGVYGARVAAGGQCVTVFAAEKARAAVEAAAAEMGKQMAGAGVFLSGSSGGAAEAAPLRISVAELTP